MDGWKVYRRRTGTLVQARQNTGPAFLIDDPHGCPVVCEHGDFMVIEHGQQVRWKPGLFHQAFESVEPEENEKNNE